MTIGPPARAVERGRPACALLIALSAVGLACGSSAPGSQGVPGADAAATLADASAGEANDGTTGQPCSTDAQCRSDGGPGNNLCSNNPVFVQSVTGTRAILWPTPVCLKEPPPSGGSVGNCDPAPIATDPGGLQIHFCDGVDAASSPGICVPFDPNLPQSGQGICYPKCTFGVLGEAARGCQGSDACVFFDFALTAGSVVGYGYCRGGCQVDSDCAPLSGGTHCQPDLGFCTPSLPVARGPIGSPCTSQGAESGACNCNFGSSTQSGYCTTACRVGGVACPPGWVCDSAEPATVTFAGASETVALAAPSPGLAGICAPTCGVSPRSTPASLDPVDAGSSDGASLDGEVDSAAEDAGDAGSAADVANGSADGSDVAVPGGDAGAVDATGSLGGGEASVNAEAGASPDEDASSAADVLVGEDGDIGSSCPGALVCLTTGVAGPDCQP